MLNIVYFIFISVILLLVPYLLSIYKKAKIGYYKIKRAANKGILKAQLDLGDMHYYGNGVDENNYKAIKWYKKASSQGSSIAKQSIVTCYILIAENGDANAFYELGKIYYHGQYGFDIDKKLAMEWFKKGAMKGNYNSSSALKKINKSKF